MDRRELLEIQRDDLRELLKQEMPFHHFENVGNAWVPHLMQWPRGMKTRLAGTLLLVESELQELRK